MSNLPSEPEFEQAYKELASSLEDSTLFKQHPEYRTALEVAAIPERVIQFRVVWGDDKGKLRVNRGYRVQFNSTLGPYKGGLRFHPTVNLSILKFLGFEQTFKNALTGLNMGGAKGGADFDPKGKSDAEIRRFCCAFMRELSKHIGPATDVPAGDIGVSGREIGFMFGAYRQARTRYDGVLTGKGLSWGGSLIRPEATGYGLVYYVGYMLQHAGRGSIAGKRVAISGSGNVAQYAALKCIELGATVVSLSDSKGSLVAEGDGGFTPKQIRVIAELKLERKALTDFPQCNGHTKAHTNGHTNGLTNGVNGHTNGLTNGVNGHTNGDTDGLTNGVNGHANGDTNGDHEPCGFRWVPGARPWEHVGKVDIALPCATQNEVSGDEARALVAGGVLIVAEGSNMGCTQDAIDVFEAERRKKGDRAVWYAPGKASNCGGVAVSGLEMAQNNQRLTWTADKVDERLKDIMKRAFDDGLYAAGKYVDSEEGELPSLVAGSNIAGFVKVAQAMHDQGEWW